VVSRAPLAEIEAFKKRMGWRFDWVSSNATDFNYDYQVSMTKDELEKGQVYYNYSMQKFRARNGPERACSSKMGRQHLPHLFELLSRAGHTHRGLQLVGPCAKGRDEEGLKHGMAWVRHHDKYDEGTGWARRRSTSSPLSLRLHGRLLRATPFVNFSGCFEAPSDGMGGTPTQRSWRGSQLSALPPKTLEGSPFRRVIAIARKTFKS